VKPLPVIPVATATLLPPLYAAWMDALLEGPIPPETEATCDDCAMCPRASDPGAGTGIYFDPKVKCCSMFPELANFLVGRLLGDDDPALAPGRDAVRARIRAGAGITPLGLGRSPLEALLYQNRPAGAFGRSRALRCPYFVEDAVSGGCGVWRHRAAVCATYFCKHVRGAVGQRFWKALHQLLGAVETALARHAALELGLDASALRRLFPLPGEPAPADADAGRQLDGSSSDEPSRRALFGRFAGREEAFYGACAAIVDGLAWADVERVGGPDVRLYARLARAAHDELLSDHVPLALRPGAVQIVASDRDFVRVWSYSHYDPVAVPKGLLDVLCWFDGRPTAEAVRAIEAARGVKLDAATVRKLVDFGILVPA